MKMLRCLLTALFVVLPTLPLSGIPTIENVSPANGMVVGTSEVTLQGAAPGAVSVTVDGQAASLVGDSWTFGPVALVSEGANAFTIIAADDQGDSTSLTLTVVRDTTPPTVSVSSPASGALRGASSVTVSGGASDAHLTSVTVSGVSATLSGGSFVALGVSLTEGSNALVVRAEDTVGNATEVIHPIVLDTQSPTVSITDPVAGTVVPDASITVRGSASDAHLDRVEVEGVTASLLGDGTWSRTVALAEGINDIAVSAFDALGHRTDASVTVARDSQAPDIEIVTPDDGLITQAGSIDVSGTVDDEAGVTVTLGGVSATVNVGAFSLSDVALVPGENRLVARATDAQGNEGVHTRTVVRDNESPTLLSSSPATGALAVPSSTIFRLTFSEVLATPNASDWRLETAGGTAIAAAAEHDGAVLRIVPASALPSATSIRLVLTTALVDRAGNPLAVETVLDFGTADTGAPDSPMLDPVATHLCAGSVTLSGTAEASSLVEARGGAGNATVRADSTGAFSLIVPLVPEAPSVLKVTATDSGGNTSQPATVTVVQDCEPPSVTSATVSAAGDTIEIRFDESMIESTVASAIGVSSSAGAVAGTVSLDPSSTLATFTPDAALPTESIEVAVSTAATDLAGNALAFPFTAVVGALGDSFLSGVVIDDATGRPLGGARVVITATDGVALADPLPIQTTDSDGGFLLAASPGSHDLTIAKAGYTPVFRIVGAATGEGSDVFDPRLTPIDTVITLDSSGGTVETDDASSRLDVPSGALTASTPVSLTVLGEQGLPSRLPFGWSPRGAAWVDLGDGTLATPATVALAVDAADGISLPIVSLDLASLSWRIIDISTVIDGAVTASIDVTTAVVAVEPDTGTHAPPAAVVGETLGASVVPSGAAVLEASLAFDPETVFADQTSLATATFVVAEEAPSGLPLTLEIAEQLELLDGTMRSLPPFEADFLLHRDALGQPRSRFRIQPSASARMLPIAMGSENVSVRPYLGGTIQGNVLGTDGGSVENADGDRIDVPPGALVAPTAITLGRGTVDDLPSDGTPEWPRGVAIDGVVTLDLGDSTLQSPASLSLAMVTPPAGTEDGLLLHVIDLEGHRSIRPVARLVPTASGWSTQAIDAVDLPWPGVVEGGVYAFARFTADHGFVRGTARDVAGDPLGGAILSSPAVDWVQLSDAAGRYVLPLPLGTTTIEVFDPETGNASVESVSVDMADGRVDFDPTVAAVVPTVVAVTPADGATGVIPGIEPTIRFSESIDPDSVPGSIALLDNDQPLDVSLLVTDDTVRMVPPSSLIPGRSYRIEITRGIRDLAGNALDASVTSTFVVAEATLPTGVDPTRIFLVEPDGAGRAPIRGLTGAVPSQTLVFVENTSRSTSTESVNAAPDGRFDFDIEADFGDRLLLHILIEGANEVLLPLEVFMTADLRTAFVADEGGAFTTVDGLGFEIEAGTFETLTRVGVSPRTADDLPLPVPDGLVGLIGFDLDLTGVDGRIVTPNRRMSVRLPLDGLAAAPQPGDGLILASSVEARGRRWWMVDDLLRLDGDALTNAPAESTGGGFNAVVTGSSVTGSSVRSAPGPFAKMDAGEIPATPGITHAGSYQAIAFANMALLAVPNPGVQAAVFSGSFIGVQLLGLSPNLIPSHFFLPTVQGQPAPIEGWDLSTGEILYSVVLPPSASPIHVVQPSELGVGAGPFPRSASPIGLYSFVLPMVDAASGFVETLGRGVTVETVSGGVVIEVKLAPGTAAPDAEVRLTHAPPSSVTVTTHAAADGSATLLAPARPGVRYVLAVGASVTTDQAIEIRFNEPVDIPRGLMLERNFNRVPVTVTRTADDQGVVLRPREGWRTGQPYRLKLTKELTGRRSEQPLLRPEGGCGAQPDGADGTGDACAGEVSVEIDVRESAVISTFPLRPVRDVARLGSLLFIAAGGEGLAVLDVSDPANMKTHLGTFPLPLDDEVRGVEVDPHGRVIYVGGGVANFGVLRILDVQSMTSTTVSQNPDTWREVVSAGRSIVSDRFDRDEHPGLSSGKPVDVTLVSDDATLSWVVGETPPTGIVVGPDPLPEGDTSFDLTVSGTNGFAGLPVTLRNETRGRFRREDAEESGAYDVTLSVEKGDTVTLLRNRRTYAYVALEGDVEQAPLVVVDVSRVYRRELGTPDDVGPTSGVLANIFPSDFQITQAQATTAFCSANSTGEVVNFRQVQILARDETLTFVGLARNYGITLLDVPDSDLTNVRLFLGGQCGEVDGQRRLSGMAIAERHTVRLIDPESRRETTHTSDYVVMAHELGTLLVVDIGDREHVRLVSKIRLPGPIGRLVFDKASDRLFVAGRGAGLYIVDFSFLSLEPLDADGDGLDDRLLETIDLGGNVSAAPLLVPELGLAFAGGLNQGVSSIALDAPPLRLVAGLAGASGPAPVSGAGLREVARVAPFGVPTATDANGFEMPGEVRARAVLPSVAADASGEVAIEVAGVSPEGEAVRGAGDVPGEAGANETVPPTIYTDDALAHPDSEPILLARQAENPWEAGYNVFLSEHLVVLADLRASSHVDMSAAEKSTTGLCNRCDLVEEGVYITAAEAASAPKKELLSGHGIALRLTGNVRTRLAEIYDASRIGRIDSVTASVPWDLSPARKQEPTRNPAMGHGDVAPGTLLHSGEMTITETDLAIRGRGLDVAFVRTHRNQTLGNGPFGPGWDHGYRQRLRALPNGDVEYFDGRGRRETFVREGGAWTAPSGRFWTLERFIDAFTITDPRRNRRIFDLHGRLIEIRDAVKVSDDTGNSLRFAYDDRGRLARIVDDLDRVTLIRHDDAIDRITEIEDFTGRIFKYRYDPDGRLVTFETPAVDVVADGGVGAPASSALETHYAYSPPASGSLSKRLRGRDNVVTCTDPKGQDWLKVSYADPDGDTHADEVVGQVWGGPTENDALTIAYPTFGGAVQVTDRRGTVFQYTLDPAGHELTYTEPAGDGVTATWSYAYNDDGLVTRSTQPLGRVTEITYDDAVSRPRRGHGDVLEVEVSVDSRGANGSDATLTTTTAYDADTHQPIQVTDPRGAVTVIARQTNSGLPTKITQPEGVETEFEYNAFGQVTKVINPNDHATTLAYFETGDSRGYLRKRIVGVGGPALETSFETDARGNVTVVRDPRGVEHETAYNALDWPTETIAAKTGAGTGSPPLEYTSKTFYDRNGNVVRREIPFDQGDTSTEQRYAYDTLDAVLEEHHQIEGSTFAVTRYERDANRNVTKITDPQGNETHVAYDARNLSVERQSNLGTDKNGATIVETFGYNRDRERIRATNGLGKDWHTSHDGYGRVKTVTDPLGNEDHQSYDNTGNATCMMATGAVIDSGPSRLLAAMTRTHDLLGRPTVYREHLFDYASAPDANADNDGFGADPATSTCPTKPIARNAFLAFGDATVLETSRFYDAASNLVQTRDAEGRWTMFEYDAAERLVARVDPLMNRQDYTLDANGNVIEMTSREVSASGTATVTTSTKYDALDRPVEQRDGMGNKTTTTYDARNLPRLVIDPEMFTQTHGYDGLNRKTFEVKEPGISVAYLWDKSSRLRNYTDAHNNVSSWTYDAANRRITQTLPGNDRWVYTYDEAHNPLTTTDPNGTVITNGYDDANRLLTRDVVKGPEVVGPVKETYTLDGLDRLLRATSGDGTATDVVTAHTYDSASRLLGETTLDRVITYRYDAVHNRIGTVYPSGLDVATSVDLLDRPDQVTIAGQPNPAVDYGYRGPWLRETATYANGLASVSTFDNTWRSTKTTVAKPMMPWPAFEETLAWSPRSLKTAIGRGDANGRGFVQAYDQAHRLTASLENPAADNVPNNTVVSAATTQTLGYLYNHDLAQNLTGHAKLDAGQLTSVSLPTDPSGRNRPGAVGGAPFGYDENGNRTTGATHRYAFDFRNRLTEVRDAANILVATYTYDAFNRRVRKEFASGGSEEMAYAGWQEVERYTDGVLDQRYIRGANIDEIVLMNVDTDGDGLLETDWTPLYDSTGNLVKLTDSAGQVVARYDYDPFGNAQTKSDLIAPSVELLYADAPSLGISVNFDLETLLNNSQVVLEQLAPPSQSSMGVTTKTAVARTITRTSNDGPIAGRHHVITLDVAPAAGTAMRLAIPADTAVDRFGNTLAEDYVVDFTWPASGVQVIHDTADPDVERVRVDEGVLEITFSEPPGPNAADAITVTETVPGQSLATKNVVTLGFAIDEDGYTLVGAAPLPAGSYAIEISGTGPIDLAGNSLGNGEFTTSIAVTGDAGALVAFERPDPANVPVAAFVNRFGFNGRPVDLESGLVYFRNRYFDPETGRFVSADPLGYVDGPSMYQGFGNSPLNYSDPLGLCFACRGKMPDLVMGASPSFSPESPMYAQGEAFLGAIEGTAYLIPETVEAVRQFPQAAKDSAAGFIYYVANRDKISGDLWAWAGSKYNATVEFGSWLWNDSTPRDIGRIGGPVAMVSGSGFARMALKGFGDGRVRSGFMMAGPLAGKDVLRPEVIDRLRKFLSRHNVELLIDDDLLEKKGATGLFRPLGEDGAELVLGSGANAYQVAHELSHFFQWKELGPGAFWAQREIEAERFVYESLKKPSRWNRLPISQQWHAQQYYDEVRVLDMIRRVGKDD